jgi:hypothetical protein
MAKERVYPTIEHIQEVTLFNTKQKAKGALETLKWLDEGAPHKFAGLKGKFKFAMDHFIAEIGDTQYEIGDTQYKIDGKQGCGTVCCMAGAIYSFSHKANGNKPHVDASMDTFFGLSLSEELYSLFYADDVDYLEDITVKDAARALRKYLNKGVVDWSHLKKKL